MDADAVSNAVDLSPLQLPPQLQRGHYSKQSKVSILDRAVEIHPNIAHCSIFFGNIVHVP
jgi:hypothetical protein